MRLDVVTAAGFRRRSGIRLVTAGERAGHVGGRDARTFRRRTAALWMPMAIADTAMSAWPDDLAVTP
jgi:hypothetical protein